MSNDRHKFFNGTAYKERTPLAVLEAIERARENNWRVMIDYGDPKTGKPNGQQPIGLIGRSMGTLRLPVLVESRTATTGGIIRDDEIVAIRTLGGGVLYKHENFSEAQSNGNRDK